MTDLGLMALPLSPATQDASAVAELRARIEAFPLPDGTVEERRFGRTSAQVVPFDELLQDRLRIASTDADKLVREYRRFLTLKALTGEDLTPSDIIDQVWHIHMEFPEAYAAFCRKAAGRDITHKTGLPKKETRRLYAHTRDLYRQVFGERPPFSVWPRWNLTVGTITFGLIALHVAGWYLLVSVFDLMGPVPAAVWMGLLLLVTSAPFNTISKGSADCG
jgi:hypothetical protein